MLKFIKLKQHEGYLLYYSVLFVVIVILTVIKKSVLRIEVRDKKNLRIARVCTLFMSLVLISAGENLDKKVIYERK